MGQRRPSLRRSVVTRFALATPTVSSTCAMKTRRAPATRAWDRSSQANARRLARTPCSCLGSTRRPGTVSSNPRVARFSPTTLVRPKRPTSVSRAQSETRPLTLKGPVPLLNSPWFWPATYLLVKGGDAQLTSSAKVGAVQVIHLVRSAVPAGCGAILPSGAAFFVRNARMARFSGSPWEAA